LILTSSSKLGIILVEPRIPQNVGNIGRLCACTGAELLLVGDLGFSFNEKYLKRAGMDYLQHVTPRHFADFPDVLSAYPDWTFSFYSTRANKLYTETPFQDRHFLIFGSETQGLPEPILQKYPNQSFRIPMLPDRRSLNLSTAVGIVLYEGLRQLEGWPVSEGNPVELVSS
jgi:tRNA (cytidine/uridine-2'-O-)-methyltransferase